MFSGKLRQTTGFRKNGVSLIFKLPSNSPTRISHKPERFRSKAFQPEDVVYSPRGLNNAVPVPLWLAFGEEFI
jgi:hypothetical protein